VTTSRTDTRLASPDDERLSAGGWWPRNISVCQATRAEQVLGVLMVCAAIVYLGPFVPRGWVPHDEGMLGQSAEWVLRGGLPHVDYEEAYTGGLSLLYAGLFKAVGIELVHLRWLLFAAAAAAQFIVYIIARRFLAPIGAAITTWIARCF
jgi:hypothetical protein